MGTLNLFKTVSEYLRRVLYATGKWLKKKNKANSAIVFV